MTDVMERISVALNAHDLEAFVALFASDYRSEQPAHPARAFQGADQVRTTWAAVFAGVPDLTAELLTSAEHDGVEFGEWRWDGTHVDGTSFAMRGAMVLGVANRRIAWGRLSWSCSRPTVPASTTWSAIRTVRHPGDVDQHSTLGTIIVMP